MLPVASTMTGRSWQVSLMRATVVVVQPWPPLLVQQAVGVSSNVNLGLPYEQALVECLLGFPLAEGLPTIPTGDGRYAAPTGEGHITFLP
jgi:hypothetical protein